jgi:hypothetical protein
MLHSAVLPTPQFRLSELLALAHDGRDSAHMFSQTSHFVIVAGTRHPLPRLQGQRWTRSVTTWCQRRRAGLPSSTSHLAAVSGMLFKQN